MSWVENPFHKHHFIIPFTFFYSDINLLCEYSIQ